MRSGAKTCRSPVKSQPMSGDDFVSTHSLPIRLLDLGAVPPGDSQAVYHVLAEQMQDETQDTIILCRPNAPYLCLGYHQTFGSIFDQQACTARSLPVYRRQLGGGATYLDAHQLFYQCVFHHRHMPVMIQDIYAAALAAPVLALRHLGLQSTLRDMNEIEVDGKRIAGTGGGRIGEATVVVGNLLFDFDSATMAAVWNTPSSAFRDLALQAMQAHILNLRGLSVETTIEEVNGLLIACFAETTGRPLLPGTLTSTELAAVQEKSAALASPETRASQPGADSPSPMHVLKISARASIRYETANCYGYTIRANFWLTGDTIQQAVLESTPPRAWLSAEQRLRGAPWQKWQEYIAD